MKIISRIKKQYKKKLITVNGKKYIFYEREENINYPIRQTIKLS